MSDHKITLELNSKEVDAIRERGLKDNPTEGLDTILNTLFYSLPLIRPKAGQIWQSKANPEERATITYVGEFFLIAHSTQEFTGYINDFTRNWTLVTKERNEDS